MFEEQSLRQTVTKPQTQSYIAPPKVRNSELNPKKEYNNFPNDDIRDQLKNLENQNK